MTSWTEILKANKGLHARDSFSELWGLKLKAARAEFPDYTITGTLPLSFNSRVAGALKNYRIYGTSAGSGTPTESGEPAGYKIPILMSNKPINLFDSSAVTVGKTIYANGQIADSAYSSVSDYTKIPLNCSNLFLNWEYETLASSTVRNMVFYNSEKSIIGSYQYQSDVKTREIPLVTGTAYVRFSIDNNASDVTLTTEAPSTSNYDLFIGDTKLGEEEYLDYAEQKIYKEVSGTLTPTDPPIPLPAINAYKGENTLSSTETLGEVSVKGRISEVQNG